jgi:integrase
MKGTWIDTRARLTETLQNPRLKKITFYTFRHWKATTEYHRTRDILHVQQLLGHREIKNTMIHIAIEHTTFGPGADDEFTARETEKPEETKALLETSFEYIRQKDNLAFLRKPK